MCGNRLIAASKSKISHFYVAVQANRKRKTQVWILQEKIDIVVVFIVFIIRCVYKCAHGTQLTASLPLPLQLTASHTQTPTRKHHITEFLPIDASLSYIM